MRTTLGKALLSDFTGATLAEISTAARHRESILRETTNANRQMDADKFRDLAAAIDALESE